MKHIGAISIAFFLSAFAQLSAQVSPDCANAVPICANTPVNGGTNGFGVDDFNGAIESGCLEQTITAIESNSAWYRFRTGASGQLGINIGVDSSEDWDFALYRADNCSALGEPIRCNFFDNSIEKSFLGIGEDPTGDIENFQYEDWIQVAPGEDYYLLINNFTDNNSGFSIQFSGEIFITNPHDALDCSIIDNLLGAPISECEGTPVVLDATTTNAATYNWFMDSGLGFQPITGENNATLSVATSASYRVEVVLPSGSTIISDVDVGFSPIPVADPVNHFSVCSGDEFVDLSTRDSEVLGVQNADDFVISYHETSSDAITGLHALLQPFPVPVTSQRIYVRLTSKENPACFDASRWFDLEVAETPILDFPDEVFLCDGGSGVQIGLTTPNPLYTYAWNTGETTANILATQEGEYTLTATNNQFGVSCSASRTVTVVVSSPPVITAIEIEDLRDENTVSVVTQEDLGWEYRIDDAPAQSSAVFTNVLAGTHTLTISDPRGCGSVTEEIVVMGFPKFFTPNGDGRNDYWEIEGLTNLNDPVISIFDRYGKLLAQLTNNRPTWDGTFSGQPLPATDYWFKLSYIDNNGQTAEAKYINNHFALKR